jgi:16S rRNA (guanine527-N7)-methyltransferase
VKPIEQRLGLGSGQIEQLQTFEALARDFNRKLNLYSQDSAREFWLRHVQHSLALATKRFPSGARVVDWGTGGGLPGIPLAVAFRQVEFVLVDSVRKKTQAVRLMARQLGLDNVDVWTGRAEDWGGTAHYSVSRATAPLNDLWAWSRRVLTPIEAGEGEWGGGLLCLKGDTQEVQETVKHGLVMTKSLKLHDIGEWLPASRLQEKLLVEVVWEGAEATGSGPGA